MKEGELVRSAGQCSQFGAGLLHRRQVGVGCGPDLHQRIVFAAAFGWLARTRERPGQAEMGQRDDRRERLGAARGEHRLEFPRRLVERTGPQPGLGAEVEGQERSDRPTLVR